MKSLKASQVLPNDVLALVQQYVQGELLYIPKPPETQKRWGDNTQSKALTALRNREIREAYRSGASIQALSLRYYLSEDSIRKIAYRRI